MEIILSLCIASPFVGVFLYYLLALIAPSLIWPVYTFSLRFLRIPTETLDRKQWEKKTRIDGGCGLLAYIIIISLVAYILAQSGSK
jgi:hypothetical protein